MIAGPLLPAQFQPVQRRLPANGSQSSRRLSSLPANIVPEFDVVVEVFVTKRNPKHALPNQGCHRVFDQTDPATFAKQSANRSTRSRSVAPKSNG